MDKLIELFISKFDPPDIRRFYRLHRFLVSLFMGAVSKTKDGHFDTFITARGDKRRIPVRVYPPPPVHMAKRVIVFFHGGGWVLEDIDRYHIVCRQLSEITGSYVVSVNYRLAPENKFPAGLSDCYESTRRIMNYARRRGFHSNDIVLMGDSAGGNLAAAVSLAARDSGEFRVRRQVLIYPAASGEFGEDSPYPSMRDNGKGCILTAERMREFLELYIDEPSRKDDPFVAPIKAGSLADMPDTLIITAGRDPLRDDGEAFAKKLYQSGVNVMAFRLKDAFHGFFATNLKKHPHAKKAVSMIMYFFRLTD